MRFLTLNKGNGGGACSHAAAAKGARLATGLQPCLQQASLQQLQPMERAEGPPVARPCDRPARSIYVLTYP